VLALVAAGAVIALNQRPAPAPYVGELISPSVVYAADSVDGETLGRADAPVVLEVWSDFQCPVCARLVREQFGTLKAQFVDTGILRIEARDIAILGSGARDESLELATGAACAARQDRYWTYHDIVFWNQGRENRGDHDAEFLAAIADRAELDRAAWDACMAGEEVRSEIKAQTIKGLQAGINATPTLTLNGGTPVAGLPDPAALIAQIQALAGAAGGSGRSISPVPGSAP